MYTITSLTSNCTAGHTVGLQEAQAPLHVVLIKPKFHTEIKIQSYKQGRIVSLVFKFLQTYQKSYYNTLQIPGNKGTLWTTQPSLGKKLHHCAPPFHSPARNCTTVHHPIHALGGTVPLCTTPPML